MHERHMATRTRWAVASPIQGSRSLVAGVGGHVGFCDGGGVVDSPAAETEDHGGVRRDTRRLEICRLEEDR